MNDAPLLDRIALLERGVRNQMEANEALERENAYKDSCIRSLRCAVRELQADRRRQAIAETSLHAGEV